MNKALAVYSWITDNNFVGNFVILDDENKDFAGTSLENNLILTNPVQGFTYKDSIRALNILKS
jgi:hypothetical protein